MQIGAAHTARVHGDEEFTRARLRHVDGDALKRTAGHRPGRRTRHALMVGAAIPLWCSLAESHVSTYPLHHSDDLQAGSPNRESR